jgi:hypothetical protein
MTEGTALYYLWLVYTLEPFKQEGGRSSGLEDSISAFRGPLYRDY